MPAGKHTLHLDETGTVLPPRIGQQHAAQLQHLERGLPGLRRRLRREFRVSLLFEPAAGLAPRRNELFLMRQREYRRTHSRSLAQTERSGPISGAANLRVSTLRAARSVQDGVFIESAVTTAARSPGDAMKDRRAFLRAVAGAVVAAPFAAFAQQPSPILRRIGFLSSESASNEAQRLGALQAGLRDLGYIEGKNIAIEVRWAEGKYERLPALASELVSLKPGAIVASGTKASLALKNATRTIPIVFGSTADPVALGLVTSLARPGGNITGSTFLASEVSAKRLELLKEALPRITQVAFLVNPADPPTALQAMEPAAKALKLELPLFEARGPSEFDSTFAAMAQRRVDAVVVQLDTLFIVNARAIADLALKHRLPSAGSVAFAEAGGMMGSGADSLEGYRRAAAYVDKIFKGANPGDLPIERPTKFQMVINLKTAKALGLAIPQSLLLRADEVIR